MKNDKVWDKINASPLLQLPPEQRKALHEAIGFCEPVMTTGLGLL